MQIEAEVQLPECYLVLMLVTMVQYSVTELFLLVWLLLWSAVFCVCEERFNSGNFTHKY